MTKRSTIGRATVNLPREFLTPIKVALPGDDDADQIAIAQGWRAYEDKLIRFAKHLAVPIDGPGDVVALMRMLAPVAKQFSGFQFILIRRRENRLGAKPTRNLIEKDALLCVTREFEAATAGEYGAATRAAKRVAIAELKNRGRPLRKAAIKSRTKTLQTRLSQFNGDEWRTASRQLFEKYFSQQFKKE